MIHDAAGIVRFADHDAAGIVRFADHDAAGGPRHHPCDARHGPLAGFCHQCDIIEVMMRALGHHAAIRRPSIPTTVQKPTG